MHRTGAIFLFALVACASTLPRSASDDVSADQSDQPVRIALATSATQAQFAFTGPWVIYNKTSEHIATRGGGDARIKVQMSGGRLIAVREDGSATSRYTGSFIVRSTTPGALVRYDGKRYRGEIIVLPTDSGMLIVNRLAVESYLRGVVPLEIGDRKPGDEGAMIGQELAHCFCAVESKRDVASP